MLKNLIFIFCVTFVSTVSAGTIEVIDLAGRKVTMNSPAKSLVLGDGRLLPVIAMLDRADPLGRVVALLSNLKRTDPQLLKTLLKQYPKARSLPMYSGNASSVYAEKIIELSPDLAVFGLQDHGPGKNNGELIVQLEAAGTTVVFIDFRIDPLANTTRSIDILGKLLGSEKEADEYLLYYTSRKQRLADRVAKLTGDKPSVFVQAHVGRMPCCIGMANGMLGPFIEFVGGKNISAAVSPGVVARHTLEFLISENPDVWIGTASGGKSDYEQGKPLIVLGPGIDKEMATKSLQISVDAAQLGTLKAIQSGRAYGIWHNFYNSAFNIYALEAFAKWIHPDVFADVDPDATLAEIHRRFSPLMTNGQFSAKIDQGSSQ